MKSAKSPHAELLRQRLGDQAADRHRQEDVNTTVCQCRPCRKLRAKGRRPVWHR